MKLPKLVHIIVISTLVCFGCGRNEPVAATVNEEIDHGEGLVVGADKTFLNNTPQSAEPTESDTTASLKKDTKKTSALMGNILNSGIVCEQDGYIYYSKKDDANRLYRIDGSGNREPVGEVTGAINLNVYEEGIVYQAGGIYRYDFDTEKSELLVSGTCRNVYMYDEKLFYLKKTDDFYKMYSAGLDGSGEKLLSENIASFMNVVDGKIYYIAGDDEGHIHVMDTDGADDTVLTSFGSVEEMVVADGIIYYVSSSSSGYQLWKLSTDGQNDQRIYDKECHNINVCDHTVYFRAPNKQMLCSIYEDGTQFEELLEVPCFSINITEDWIYFFNAEDMKYYRVRKDGTDFGPAE